MSVAVKLNRFLVMTYNQYEGETPRYIWAIDAQDAVNKAKEECSPEDEIMEVFKAVKGWKK